MPFFYHQNAYCAAAKTAAATLDDVKYFSRFYCCYSGTMHFECPKSTLALLDIQPLIRTAITLHYMVKRDKTTTKPSAAIQSKLLDSIYEIVCALDTEGRFVYVNKSCFRVLGYQAEELLGVPCFDLVIEEDKQRSIEANIAAYKGADIPVFENRYHHKNGSIITICWEGGWDFGDNLLYTVGRDVTEQRRLEQLQRQQHADLKAVQEQLSQLLERITDGFIGLDKDLRVIYWNKAAEAISGLSAQQMTGQILWEVLPEPTLAIAKGHYEKVAEENGPVHFEYFSKRIDSWIEVTSYPSESGLSVFFRDITERKHLQEQLIREREQHQMRVASAVVKATEKERAEVSKELHDNVNQVLTTVKLYTELCLSHTPSTDELLKKSMALLQNSINEIRSLSKRLSATSPGKIRLADSVRELVDSIRDTNRFKVNFEQNIPDLDVSDDVHLTVYRILQEQFTNIINHAQATVVNVRMCKKANALLVEVTDNGIGYDFNKVHEGIGIANMTTRAADVNATIDIHSEPGIGSTLTLTIPLT